MKLQFQIVIYSVILAVILSACTGGGGTLPTSNKTAPSINTSQPPAAPNPTSSVFETLCASAADPAQCLVDYKDLCGNTGGAISEGLDPNGVSVIETWCVCTSSSVGPNWDDTSGCTP